jgi:hypothetical protein
MRRVLLVEPGYRNKYPPLGLMKISTYHKLLGDRVEFVKGCDASTRAQQWDRVYVSTLFTFHWNVTMRTIRYYRRCVESAEDILVGGVMATLLGDDIEQEVDVTVLRGLLDKPGMLDSDDRYIVDHLIPDYRILETIDYDYGLQDAYIGYATRGCPNSCKFCAVGDLEPKFMHYLPLREQIRGIEDVFGQRQHLVLLDNNVLASCRLKSIVQDIVGLGFERGAKRNGRQRCVDFNQGIDARRLTPHRMKLLAKVAIKPLRLAFDRMSTKKAYVDAVRLARDYDVLHHATYVLFNYTDTPGDFYARLKISVDLNEDLGVKISSFPMKYIPLHARDRTYIGKHWCRKMIRGVQCVLLATRGMVSPSPTFFEAAFGASAEDFTRIALMPERYIIYRRRHELNGAADWNTLYRRLGRVQKQDFLGIVGGNRVSRDDVQRRSPGRLKDILAHYVEGM